METCFVLGCFLEAAYMSHYVIPWHVRTEKFHIYVYKPRHAHLSVRASACM
jgi:hypothetical protein